MNPNKVSYYLLFITSVLFISSCSNEPQPLENILTGTIKTQLNPYERVPLGAQLSFVTKKDCRVDIEVLGDIPVKRSFPSFSKFHEVPVIGLYPGADNTLKVTLTTENNRIYSGELQINTDPLPAVLPTMEVTKIDRNFMEPGFHLVDMLIANNGRFLTYTLIFDDNGVIRWFMDMSDIGQIVYTTHRLKNGNWLYLNWQDLLEIDDLGQIVKKEQVQGYGGNHEIIELQNGRLLIGASRRDSKIIREGKEVATRFDHVILWDRNQNRTLGEWNLRDVLDVDRTVYPPDYSLDFASDWFHINSIAQSPEDNSLVISGRNQGVLKVDENNNLQWILAPHRSWGKAGFDGSGFETSDYLLTAIDANGKALPEEIQQGTAGADDFEWSTGQHAITILDNGNILMFDNGLMRNFKPELTYSRAVEYRIDAEKKTIQQVWQYGKERGLNMFSPITSDVDLLPQTGNRLITAGNVRRGELPPHAKLVEITYPDNQVVFEANIYFKDALGTKAEQWAQFDLVFRGERYLLVPQVQ